MRWVGPVAAVLAAAVAGCTPVPPERIAGDPAPVTVAPTDGVTSAPTRPPGSPTPAGPARRQPVTDVTTLLARC